MEPHYVAKKDSSAYPCTMIPRSPCAGGHIAFWPFPVSIASKSPVPSAIQHTALVLALMLGTFVADTLVEPPSDRRVLTFVADESSHQSCCELPSIGMGVRREGCFPGRACRSCTSPH